MNRRVGGKRLNREGNRGWKFPLSIELLKVAWEFWSERRKLLNLKLLSVDFSGTEPLFRSFIRTVASL